MSLADGEEKRPAQLGGSLGVLAAPKLLTVRGSPFFSASMDGAGDVPPATFYLGDVIGHSAAFLPAFCLSV